jgi:hypothetical protein
MKICAGFLYMLWTIVYLSPIVPGLPLWSGIDRAVQILFVGVLCYFLFKGKPNTPSETLFFQYLTAAGLIGGLYVLACILFGVSFALFNTPIFAHIAGLTLIGFVVHCAIKKT